MHSWKTLTVLGILALGVLAVQPGEADAQFRRFGFGVQYYQPGPYYYPATTYYAPAVTPYVYPAYPTYQYRTAGYYGLPGYPAVYGGTYYYGGAVPYWGGAMPYSGTGFYYFRR